MSPPVVAVPAAAADGLDAACRWLDGMNAEVRTDARVVPLESLAGWHCDAGAGVIEHASGRFFRVEGLRVEYPGHEVPTWDQPIINQWDVGVLGVLARELDGRVELLVQAKPEPGNCNGVQISPTVQATRSNYTQVHGGRPVPYLRHFTEAPPGAVLADVLQSEHGSWFLRKYNRNMVVRVHGDVEVLPGFRWLPIEVLHGLLAVDDLVNMDTRTVLSCLPSGPAGRTSVHSLQDVLSWITEVRSRREISSATLPLNELSGWERRGGRIRHVTGRYFEVIGVEVRAAGREVARWSQPMFAARGTGLVALLLTRVEGVPHVLLQLRREPGLAGGAELAPTVQCTPALYEDAPELRRPPFLDDVLAADATAIRFDTTLSDEGGRFYHTRSRHVIVETERQVEHPDFRWVAAHQLDQLLWHSGYLNVQARSLVACLRSLEPALRAVGDR